MGAGGVRGWKVRAVRRRTRTSQRRGPQWAAAAANQAFIRDSCYLSQFTSSARDEDYERAVTPLMLGVEFFPTARG